MGYGNNIGPKFLGKEIKALLAASGKYKPTTTLGKPPGNRPSDPRTCASDQRDFSLQM